ncbi:unnamed protein product [Diatraea saccharalis]|uniref:TIL domain-containing protein n=1 Tax=Diatraea saccharalis TaxID=40085 RepID=A0A9N9WEQ5_9NEOP|nr:unnamed protein product [Diatraea saccharalis]
MKCLTCIIFVALLANIHSLECQDYEKLVTACPRMSEPTCEQINGTLRLLDCFKPECYCKDSTFRESFTGKCYALGDCPDYSFLLKLISLLKAGTPLNALFAGARLSVGADTAIRPGTVFRLVFNVR